MVCARLMHKKNTSKDCDNRDNNNNNNNNNNSISTNINHKGLQRTANENAEERRTYKDLISKNNNVDILGPFTYRSNRSFNMPPPGQPPEHLTFLKIIVQIPPYPGQNAVQMPHTMVHSGDQNAPTTETFHWHKTDTGTAETPSVVEQNLYKYNKTEKHC